MGRSNRCWRSQAVRLATMKLDKEADRVTCTFVGQRTDLRRSAAICFLTLLPRMHTCGLLAMPQVVSIRFLPTQAQVLPGSIPRQL